VIRPQLELADIFRRHGPAWRAANEGHLSLAQRRVMRAVELCRTAELGGHVEQRQTCAHTRIAYNSCRNRHCPKCQWRAAQAWLEARKAELLPVPYFHLVFTLPATLGALAYQNKARLYGLLLKTAAEALTTIAADPSGQMPTEDTLRPGALGGVRAAPRAIVRVPSVPVAPLGALLSAIPWPGRAGAEAGAATAAAEPVSPWWTALES
jgi:hypothetical protein